MPPTPQDDEEVALALLRYLMEVTPDPKLSDRFAQRAEAMFRAQWDREQARQPPAPPLTPNPSPKPPEADA